MPNPCLRIKKRKSTFLVSLEGENIDIAEPQVDAAWSKAAKEGCSLASLG